MKRRKVTIPLAGGEILSAVLALPTAGQKGVGVITAHGAGNDMEQPLLVAFSDGLAEAGYSTMRFNFPYKEKGRKTPDRPEKLEEAWAAACRYFSEDSGVEVTRIIAGGKSMGGRVASTMVSDQKLPVEGLIFLGYPLHPAGDLSKLRDAHLYRIEIPMLFFAGTKDRLCALETLQMVLAKLKAPWNLDVIEGGDHSFHIPKSMGIPESDVYARILETTVQWLEKTFGACCS
jgi:predicted alpha/beta-hydrolase family hydrolase